MMSHEAKVCRRSCHVKSLISAAARAVPNAFLTSWTPSSSDYSLGLTLEGMFAYIHVEASGVAHFYKGAP